VISRTQGRRLRRAPAFSGIICVVLVGVLSWLPVAESMRALVYGVAPADWRVLTVVGLCVLIVALLASYVPARRTSRIEPSAALRTE
jgi:putative ABC transport system permease protein